MCVWGGGGGRGRGERRILWVIIPSDSTPQLYLSQTPSPPFPFLSSNLKDLRRLLGLVYGLLDPPTAPHRTPPPFPTPSGSLKDLRRLLGRNQSEVVGRRSAEVLAAIVAGKLAPREMPPPLIREGALYTAGTRQLASGVVPAAGAAGGGTAAIAGSSSHQADGTLRAHPAPVASLAPSAGGGNSVLTARAIAPLVPKKLAAAAAPTGGRGGAGVMAATMTAAAPTMAALAGGIPAVTPAAVLSPPGLGSSHAGAAATVQSSTPALVLAPALSSRPLARPSGMGSMLGGQGAVRRATAAPGSMAGMFGAGGGAGRQGAGQPLPPSTSASAAAGERVDRLRASFTLPFVAAAAAAAAAASEEYPSGREADQQEEDAREGLQGRTRALGVERVIMCVGGETDNAGIKCGAGEWGGRGRNNQVWGV